MPGPQRGPAARSARAALALFVVAFGLFVALLPARLYGDDVWFVRCIVQAQPFPSHFLYMPLARRFADVGAWLGLDPFLSLRVLSALGAATGVALCYAAARRRGVPSAGALCFAVLPASAASGLFFATAAELHALHVGAVGLLAWCLARLGPEAPARRVFALGLAFTLVMGTHQSGVLLLPATVTLGWLATRPRAAARRRRDALAFGLAGLLGLALMAACTRLESGRWLAADETAALLSRGLLARARELGWRELVGYLSRDLVLPAFGLVLAGAGALGALLRRRPAPGAAVALALLPYLLFFPLFHFPERGAYYLVCLPVLAGVLLWLLRGPVPRPWLALLTLAALGSLARPDELERWLGSLAPGALAALLLAAGLLAAPRPAPAAARGPASGALAALALLCASSFVGALRTLRHYDRERPLLDWARDVCEATDGRDALVITCGFQEYWLLVLLHAPWPAPLRGTWAFAEALPRPTPSPFLYADPTVSSEELHAGLAGLLARGAEVLLDERVVRFVAERPAAQRARLEVDLEAIRRHHRLLPLEHGSFRAQRILPP